MDALETRVSAALTQLRVLETALHSPLRWELEVDGERAVAVPWRGTDGFEFEAEFVELPESGVVSLLHGGQVMLVRAFTRPADYDGFLAWDLSLGEEHVAA